MKSKSLIIGLFLFFVCAVNSSAQTNQPVVWTVDFVKTKTGEQAKFLKFIEQNWARARAFMKDKGIVSSYRVLSLPPTENNEWDVLLMTEYVDKAGYEKREEVFNQYKEYQKTQPADSVKVNVNPREISEIKFNRVFSRPISSETAQMMLKTQTTDAETAAARVPLENYLKGHETGDAEYMRKAFHTEGNMIFVRDGKYSTRTFAQYIAGMSGKPAEDEKSRKRWIESVEVSGNAAVGKIILDYPNGRFVDYMTLLKIGDEWKIINKSFYFEPKAAAAQK